MQTRHLALFIPLFLAGCGNGAPSKKNVEDALNRHFSQSDSAIVVTASTCTARDNAVYRCKVTGSQGGIGGTHVFDFKIINDQWTVAGLIS